MVSDLCALVNPYGGPTHKGQRARGPVHSLGGDGQKLPRSGDALQFVFAPVLEGDA